MTHDAEQLLAVNSNITSLKLTTVYYIHQTWRVFNSGGKLPGMADASQARTCDHQWEVAGVKQ